MKRLMNLIAKYTTESDKYCKGKGWLSCFLVNSILMRKVQWKDIHIKNENFGIFEDKLI